jgi:hypothetical protein
MDDALEISRQARLAEVEAENQVPEPKSTRPLTPKEHQEFQEKIAHLKAEYGAGRVKAEVKRRPKPKGRGRPKIWDYRQLFTLWLIVQTSLQDEPKIYKVFQRLAKDLAPIFESRGRVARLFYAAEAEFDTYETKNADLLKSHRDEERTLKERLFGYAEVLASYELLQWDLSLAERIVLYELELDGVSRCPCGEIHPPPLHPPELSLATEVREVRNRKRPTKSASNNRN